MISPYSDHSNHKTTTVDICFLTDRNSETQKKCMHLFPSNKCNIIYILCVIKRDNIFLSIFTLILRVYFLAAL